MPSVHKDAHFETHSSSPKRYHIPQYNFFFKILIMAEGYGREVCEYTYRYIALLSRSIAASPSWLDDNVWFVVLQK